MSDGTYVGARQEIIKNLLSETVREEVANEIKPQLEVLKEKHDELKTLRRDLRNTAEELRGQAQDLQETQRDAERVNESRNSNKTS
jgi:hypothetical protein